MIVVTANDLVEADLSAEQRAAFGARAQEVVTLDWFGRRVAVCFDEAVEADSFRRRYERFLTQGAPGVRVHALRAADDDGQPVFWIESGAAFRYPAKLKKHGIIAFLADAITHQAFFSVNPSLQSFHAAAVQVGDGAAAISAISTGGKSTTALACARRGMPLYTDERCVLMCGQVQPFPRAINVRAGGLELLGSEEVPGDGGLGRRLRARVGSDWESVAFGELFGRSALPPPRNLEAIFFIEGRAEIARAVPLALGDALLRLLRAAFCGPEPGLDRVAAATKLFQATRAYGLTLGTPDDTALLIAATTRRALPLVAVAP
jgi:hypothetical protein